MLQSMVRLGSAAGVALGIALAGASAANAESIMKECGSEWQAAKAAGTTNGQTWQEFLKSCRVQHQGGAGGVGQAAPPAPAPQQQSGSLFPWQQPPAPAATAAPVSNTSVMSACGEQWKQAKASGTTGGATWPQFLKQCRAKMSGSSSASISPAPAPSVAPAPAPAGSLFPWQQSAAPAPARLLQTMPPLPQPELHLHNRFSTAVPAQPWFGSTSTRTSTTFPARMTMGTRSMASTCARRTRRRLATARRRTRSTRKRVRRHSREIKNLL